MTRPPKARGHPNLGLRPEMSPVPITAPLVRDSLFPSPRRRTGASDRPGAPFARVKRKGCLTKDVRVSGNGKPPDISPMSPGAADRGFLVPSEEAPPPCGGGARHNCSCGPTTSHCGYVHRRLPLRSLRYSLVRMNSG